MSVKNKVDGPHHHKKVKWDDEELIDYYRLEGSSIEYDVEVPQFDTLKEAIDSGLYRLKKGNNGYQRMLDGAKFSYIIYDIHFLKRDVNGKIEYPSVSISVIDDVKVLLKTEISEQVIKTDKKFFCLDTESEDMHTGNGYISQVGIIDAEGMVIADCSFERDGFLEAKEEIASMIEGATIVGHSINLDLERMKVSHEDIYDVGLRFLDDEGQKFRLKDLINFFFSEKIQSGKHDAVEDAYHTLRLLEIFPGLPVVLISRDLLKGVCEQGGGEKGLDKYLRHLAYLKKVKEEEFFEFQRQSEERFALENTFHLVDKAWAFPIEIEYDTLEQRLVNYIVWNYEKKKFPIYELDSQREGLYQLNFSKKNGWSFVYLDEEFLDSKNKLNITYSRFILSKAILIDAAREIPGNIKVLLDYFYSIVEEKRGLYYRHNLVKMKCAEFLWDYYSNDVRKYEKWALELNKGIVVWGEIGEWMLVVDIIGL